MNGLQIFTYNGNEVRTIQKDGEPWWVLKDVCEVFGETNYRRVSGRLDEDEKGVSQIDTPGGIQNMTVILPRQKGENPALCGQEQRAV